MRIVGILIATALFGLGLVVLLVEPNAADVHDGTARRGALSACEQGLCENAIRPAAAVMRRAAISR
jgi:hypothetical protein